MIERFSDTALGYHGSKCLVDGSASMQGDILS